MRRRSTTGEGTHDNEVRDSDDVEPPDTTDVVIARRLAYALVEAVHAGANTDGMIWTEENVIALQLGGIRRVTLSILALYHRHLRAELGDETVDRLLAREHQLQRIRAGKLAD